MRQRTYQDIVSALLEAVEKKAGTGVHADSSICYEGETIKQNFVGGGHRFEAVMDGTGNVQVREL